MSEKLTIYGISNCDQVKKARVWLANNKIEYTFHDFKKIGLAYSTVNTWLSAVPLDTLLNRKSSTWRALSDPQKASATDRNAAVELMIHYPSLVKRPVLQIGKVVLAGFDSDAYRATFKDEIA